MRLIKGFFVVAALSAVSMFGVACGETEEPTGTTQCTADADCTGEGEACHPSAKVCVVTCTQASDCTDQAEANCGPVKNADGTDSTVKFCKCSTNQLCNTDDGTDLICSDVSNVCDDKCTGDSDCSGKFGAGATCITATGQCELKAAATLCTKDEDCTDATNKYCDVGTGACVPNAPVEKCDPASTTIGANGGVSICAAGEYCNASQECVAAKGTCEAANKFATAPGAASPTIYNVTITGNRAAPAASCTGGQVTQFKGSWYDAAGDVPTTGTYSKINRVSKAGVKAPTYEATSITKNTDGKSGEFTFEMCNDQKGTAEAVVVEDSAGNVSNVACFPAW